MKTLIYLTVISNVLTLISYWLHTTANKRIVPHCLEKEKLKLGSDTKMLIYVTSLGILMITGALLFSSLLSLNNIVLSPFLVANTKHAVAAIGAIYLALVTDVVWPYKDNEDKDAPWGVLGSMICNTILGGLYLGLLVTGHIVVH